MRPVAFLPRQIARRLVLLSALSNGVVGWRRAVKSITFLVLLAGSAIVITQTSSCGGGSTADVTTSVAVSPDGNMLAASKEDGTIRLWDAHSHRRLGRTLRPPVSDDLRAEVDSIAFSPDGRTLASAGRVYVLNTDYSQSVESNGYVWLWDVRSGRQRASLPSSGSDTVTSLAFSPDGRTLVSISDIDDPSSCLHCSPILLWDVRSHKQLAQFASPRDSVRSVAFSPDGHTLAAAKADGTIRLWDVRTHGPGRPLHLSDAKSIAFNPDGRILAAGSNDGTIQLWDVRQRQRLGSPLQVQTSAILSLAFSPDGHTLAAARDNGRVVLWDVRSHRRLGPPLGRPIPGGYSVSFSDVAFSPDGRTLASCDDYGLWLWDVRTHRQIDQLSG